MSETDLRNPDGTFATGNPGGPGRPRNRFAGQVGALREAIYRAVTAEDLEAVFRAMIREARSGNKAAAKLICEYSIGRPLDAPDILERLEALEGQLDQ